MRDNLHQILQDIFPPHQFSAHYLGDKCLNPILREKVANEFVAQHYHWAFARKGSNFLENGGKQRQLLT